MSGTLGARPAERSNPNDALVHGQTALEKAFQSFASAAGSLEASYSHLQADVVRLRHELELKNRDLALSLAENQGMRAYLARIVDSLPCGVAVVDRSFRFRVANPEAFRLLRLPSSLLLKLPSSVPEPIATQMRQIVAGDQAGERPWVSNASAEGRSMAVACATLPEDSPADGSFVFILRDTTEQKRLEAEREAVRRTQALAEMTALLAHEIRNPLGSLELFAGLIGGATVSLPEVNEWVVHLQAGLRALSATVNNVLQFHTQAQPQTIPTNIGKLLDDTAEFLRPLALQRGMGINLENLHEEVLIAADPHALQQVFFNLAINAFRAMSPGGSVKVRATTESNANSDQALIDFEDNGSGITAANLERIFDPGFTTNPGSPGLGLAVCKRVVEQHRGAMKVKSVPGKGSTFTLSFPVLRSAA